MKNERFGRLLKGMIKGIADYEGKTAPSIEDELGDQIGLSGASIQRYKAGHVPPEPRTVEILAEAGVKRGYLNREWLRNFLQSAVYPSPEKLLDRLCPAVPIRPRPPRVYENLPAPTYSQFIMRKEPYEEILDGLRQRSAVVVIASLGGMGKTSLAREVAACCLKDDGDAPNFDAAVWVSDKDRPGTTTMSIVLDEIARTLDYPGFTQFEHEEKQREVEQLLRRQRVLMVIDNFETITDGALLAWLLRLPEPSKAIITTREYRREFRRGTWPIELRGMNEAEAQAFINQRVRLLRIERMVSDSTQFTPLMAATGSNPKAIEMALGYLKYQHQPLQQVVDDLYAARGDIFDDLFSRAWSLLDEAARRVLLAMPLFPASASGEALSATADVRGFAFDNALGRLIDLALLDAQQPELNASVRYTLHPLVRAFANAKLVEQQDFETGARERWMKWYVELVSRVGNCWEDLSKLKLLDPEQETIYPVVTWAYQERRYAETIQLARGIRFYYNVRGLWDKRLTVNLMRLDAARFLSDKAQEAHALAYHVETLCKQGNPLEAEKYLPSLHDLMRSAQFPLYPVYAYEYAIAWYAIATDDLNTAQRVLESLLSLSRQLSDNAYIVTRRWLAMCLYRKGDIERSRQLYWESLLDAEKMEDVRSAIACKTGLAAIALDLGRLDEADRLLADCKTQAGSYQDRKRLSEILPLIVRLHIIRDDIPAAQKVLLDVINIYERLGMRRKLAVAHEEFAQLAGFVAPQVGGTPD